MKQHWYAQQHQIHKDFPALFFPTVPVDCACQAQYIHSLLQALLLF